MIEFPGRSPAEAGPQEIYFDNNATTFPLPEVVEAVAEAMAGAYGNPSSLHRAGNRARTALRRAREQVASLLSAREDEVIFTSGTTEANNLVLLSLLRGSLKGFRLVTTNVEHSSILQAARHLETEGVPITVLEVDGNGLVDRKALVEAIEPRRTLVSIQWANNETGVVQPIPELAAAAHAAGAVFHSDAAQAVGKIPLDLSQHPVDLISVTGHKVHGPLGVGALVGPGVTRVHPLTFGGSQERSLRPGTENLAGIIGLGVALEIRAARFEVVARTTRNLRDRFEALLEAKGVVAGVNGRAVERLPNTSNIRFSEVDGEALVIRVDLAGIRCSQSSACTNSKPEPSYVLRAMGLSESEAYASVRFGFSELNTVEEVDHATGMIEALHNSLLRFAVA